MKVRLRFRAALAGLLVGSLLFGAAWAQSPDPEKAAKDSIRALDLQTELPHQHNIEPIKLRLPQELVWVLLACAAAFLLYAMRDSLVWRRRPAEDWGEAGPGGSAGGVRSDADALFAADELARQGRFVDAMHTLLLQSLADIRRRLGIEFAELAHQPRDPTRHPATAARPGFAARDRCLRGVDLFRRLPGSTCRLQRVPEEF